MSELRAVIAQRTALVVIDLQNDFLDAKGAYARGGDSNPPALLLRPAPAITDETLT